MKRIITLGIVLESLMLTPGWAALDPGDPAPDFTVQVATDGKQAPFVLTQALQRGPVVLYFYPKSFTRGCTIEAHLFAEAAESFASAGATLIGMSADTIDTQLEFSSKECRDKFPVAADPNLTVIKAYDALRTRPLANGETVSDRISYVIAPTGKIVYSYVDSAPEKHVDNTLAVVRQWQQDHK